ncbi:MAG: hypothetical protein ABIT07_07005 [Ferruginibacter sp.]
MNLKKIIPAFLLASCISLSVPVFATNVVVPAIENPSTDAHVQQLMTRLAEIRNMDKSSLSSTERKDLRKEVKAMKAEVRANRKGVYLSIGAAIIIVLLLIILL